MTLNKNKPLPLEGVTVVSLEQAVAAPLCTRQLAEQGARVIKVERPGSGDFARAYDHQANGMSSHFVWINRSKESLTLDLKTAEAQEIIHTLLAKADVLVQNLAPGAMARMGLSFEDLHRQYPKLIVCDVSGYGEGGPYEAKKAYDLLIQSESGFLSVTGTADADGMAKAGCSVADIAAGMYASNAILSALLLRGRTGEGSHIDISMLESLVEWMGYPMYYSYDGAQPPKRAGASHSTIYPYGPFPVGDGTTVMLGLQNDREWCAFCCRVLNLPNLSQDPRYLDNPRRSANRTSLGALIDEVFARMTLDEVISRLDEAGIANASVNDMAQVWQHPQLAARDRWIEVATPMGPVPALKTPGLWFPDAVSAVPAVGEHSGAILKQIGYSSDRIDELRRDGVIGHQRNIENRNLLMTRTSLKTMLFVPASRPERIPKAIASGTDAVIVDLEDSVPANAKHLAREALDAFLADYQGAPIYVRINARTTVDFEADLALCARHVKVAGVMLPKAESADDVHAVANSGKAVIPLIETARGLVALNEIAAARGVERLSYGGLDLSDNLGIESNTEGAETIMDQCRYQLLVSSRAAGLPAPIETVFPVLDDERAVIARARRARSMGFAGMLCIHPKQIVLVQAGFAPDPSQVEWANKVVEAARTGTGAFKVEGQMVDAPVIAMARTILERSR